jgi:hypothetical protein
VSAGGAWIWDARVADPWSLPSFEQCSHLRIGEQPGTPGHLSFPTSTTIDVGEPGMSDELAYEIHKRTIARQVVKGYASAPGLQPTEHLPSRRAEPGSSLAGSKGRHHP